MAIPALLQTNNIAKVLDKVHLNYSRLSRDGAIKGLMVVDQDAKVLAVNRHFYTKANFWDLGAIGAALYGVSVQGQDFFHASALERATLIYGDLQVFVHSIGNVEMEDGKRRELLILVLADKSINIGLIILQMRKFSQKIKAIIEDDQNTQTTMKMTEQELKSHIFNLKKQLFASQMD